ncbi:MAG: tetratricopeptide repeat protein [Symploca sp. SIO2E9]|nr:tetratricopeptide repeat protein [Symploca sp. SIO2E9]
MVTVSETLQLAVQHHRANRLPQAKQFYDKILKIQPKHPEALHGLGMLAQQVGQYENAEKFFNAILYVQPNSVKAWFSLGNLRQVQGQLPEAVEAYHRVLAMQPKLVAVHNNLGYTLQQQGLWEEALACYQKALEVKPDSIEISVNWANALHVLGKLPPEKQPYYAALNHDLGLSQKKAGDLKNAITYYRQAIALQPDLALAHYNLGLALQEQGKLEEAIDSYQQALELNSSDAEVYNKLIHNKLSQLYRQQNKLKKADSPDRLKIAFIGQPMVMTSYPKPADSIGILTYELVSLLSSDCEVIVYTPGESFKEVSHQGVDYRYIPISQDKLLLKYLEKFPGFDQTKRPIFGSNLYYLGYILRIANDLRKQQCDVVHIHNFSQFIPVIRAFNPGIKIVLHMHCEWLSQLDKKSLEGRLSKVDLVIGPSQYITKAISQRFPQFAQRCQAIANGVNVERFINSSLLGQNLTNKNNVKRLLFVGRVCPEKGVHVLLEAFQKVVAQYPETQLTLVGPLGVIPYEYLVALSDDPKVADLVSFHRDDTWISYLKKQLSQLNGQAGDNVPKPLSLAGLVPPSNLAKYYQQTDIFIFPSICHEAFGMPIAEAMVAGVPVIATHGGAFPELVEDGKTGKLVERSDADALAEAIIQLFSDEELRKSLGQAGRKRAVEFFSFEKVADDLLSQYKNICGKSVHGS